MNNSHVLKYRFLFYICLAFFWLVAVICSSIFLCLHLLDRISKNPGVQYKVITVTSGVITKLLLDYKKWVIFIVYWVESEEFIDEWHWNHFVYIFLKTFEIKNTPVIDHVYNHFILLLIKTYPEKWRSDYRILYHIDGSLL